METNTNTPSKKDGTWFDRYGTPVALLVGLVVIAAAIYFGHDLQPGSQGTSGSTSGTQAAPAVNIKNVTVDADTPVIGNANAPVTMALFFDYQCPFCQQFDETVLPQLYANYVQTGKLKIVFKDFDFIGPDSLTASEFARALWHLYPDQFYAFYQAVYKNQLEESHTADASYLPHLEQLAGTLPGVDVSKVVALMNQNKSTYDTEIQASFTQGQSFGIQGTPSVIVGTTLLQGAQTYATVSALVDAQLKQ